MSTPIPFGLDDPSYRRCGGFSPKTPSAFIEGYMNAIGYAHLVHVDADAAAKHLPLPPSPLLSRLAQRLLLVVPRQSSATCDRHDTV